EPLQLDLVNIVVSSGFSALHGLSNLCIGLLVILSPTLCFIKADRCALMEWHAVSHKAPQDIFRGSSAFGGIVNSYFSGSLMDTYGVGFVQYSKEKKNLFFVLMLLLLLLLLFLLLFLRLQSSDSDSDSNLDSAPRRTTRTLPTGRFLRFKIGIKFGFSSWFNQLVNLPSHVVSVINFIGFVIVFQIVGVVPRRTRHDVLDAVLQRFPHLLPLEPLVFLVAQTLQLLVGLGIGALPIAAVAVQICTIFFAIEFLGQSIVVRSSICVPRVSMFGRF
ncbi:hypothetical protein CR513_53187, partial [Mucuna pruriens]